MHDQRHWLQVGLTFLLGAALTACSRSASSGITTMTPLPSAPPPTPTDILPTQTAASLVSVTVSETSTATSEPVKKATATKAQLTESITVTCAGAPSTRLSIGGFAYVNPEPPLPNNLRSESGENNELIGYIEPGQSMKILEGPECVDGWLWWKVQTVETDLTGWTAEGDEQGYWLVPCTSQEQCGS